MTLGVIGGSGFYQMPGLERVEQIELKTPFGAPSDPYYRGKLGEIEVVFLARHGRGHRILPSEMNYRANIYGMKQLGVEHLVSVSTAGSMKEEIKPGDSGGARSVHRPYLQTARDLFRQRHRRARLAGRSRVRRSERAR